MTNLSLLQAQPRNNNTPCSTNATMMASIYRSCFALNNAGVSMLEQYPAQPSAAAASALSTVRVAASALKKLATLHHLPLPQQQTKLVQLVQHLDTQVKQAFQTVAQLHLQQQQQQQQPQEEVRGNNQTSSSSFTWAHLEVYALDQDDMTNLHAASHYGTSATTVIHPIRIRHVLTTTDAVCNSMTGCCASADWDMNMAILFYNYGLAQRVKYSRCLMDRRERHQHLHGAGQLFTLASRLLSRNLVSTTSIADSTTDPCCDRTTSSTSNHNDSDERDTDTNTLSDNTNNDMMDADAYDHTAAATATVYESTTTDSDGAADVLLDEGMRLRCLFVTTLVLGSLTLIHRLLHQHAQVQALEQVLDHLHEEAHEYWEIWNEVERMLNGGSGGGTGGDMDTCSTTASAA